MKPYKVSEDPRMVASARILVDAAPPMTVETARTIAGILGPALAAVTAADAAPTDVEQAA